ncbi:amino acid deaminase [Amnibacterium sp.]|uniref:amino acid deaminase n=1 Tax=Amnibacterium sp. TaxID=1872496 RepID=UPI00262CD50D|nr:amino acid deaminase [Amnibacterium sp.]
MPLFAPLILGPEHKSMPPSAWGRSREAYLAGDRRLADLATPVLAIDDGAVAANTMVMADWAAERGLLLAPHGKTSMAPALWQRLLDAGAWGLTLATPWQVQVGRAAGVSRILLANELVDPVGIRWLCGELDADPRFEFLCWADGVDGVRALAAAVRAAGARRPVDVLVELGGAGGRAGTRSHEVALEVAAAIESSGVLRLAGVGGYEGALAHDRSPEGLAAVRDHLERMRDLAHELAPRIERPVISAGGSAYFDLVAEVLGPETGTFRVILRSGAYQLHDSGFYASISPFGRAGGNLRLRPALSLWSRVLSRPEPDLAILDAGRRDASFDEGLPVPELVRDRPDAAGALAGARVEKLNDQHAFLRLDPARSADLAVGDVVRLGISHPCTALDKWRLLPVIDSADAAEPRVVGLVETVF